LWPVSATAILKTRTTPETKARVAKVAQAQLLTESVWLRQLVLRELRAGTPEDEQRHRGDGPAADVGGARPYRRAPGSSLYIRLRPEDRLLLQERAAARGMASATYVSVLVRSHLRSLVPLPKDEFLALRSAVSELGAVGRNLNQIARAANQGARIAGVEPVEFKAMLRICEALRDHTKGLIKANEASWSSGHADSSG
jgi:hypothetical protein